MSIAADISLSSPNVALEKIASFCGPLLIDFDETLYLRNSTEEYIDFLSRRIAVRFLLKVLDIFRPWLLTGGRQTRDVWRLILCRACHPILRRRWREESAQLAAKHTNSQLVRAVNDRSRAVYVVSAGFEPIIRPILRNMGLTRYELVACRFRGMGDRAQGKARLAMQRIDADVIRSALTISDSLDDAELMRRSKDFLFVKWPGAKHVPADSGMYIPFEYTIRVKRPKMNFFLRSVILDDYALWLLATISCALTPLLHVAGVFFLLVAFWIIYEQGYVDNDYIANRYESDPILTDEYFVNDVKRRWTSVLLWCAGSSLAGIYLVKGDLRTQSILSWLLVLSLTWVVYYTYNRLDKMTRVWLYALLQLLRSAAFLVLIQSTTIGLLAIGCYSTQRWITYFLYRQSGKEWPETPHNLMRVIIGVLFIVPFGSTFISPGGIYLPLLLPLWMILRAVANVFAIVKRATFIAAAPIGQGMLARLTMIQFAASYKEFRSARGFKRLLKRHGKRLPELLDPY